MDLFVVVDVWECASGGLLVESAREVFLRRRSSSQGAGFTLPLDLRSSCHPSTVDRSLFSPIFTTVDAFLAFHPFIMTSVFAIYRWATFGSFFLPHFLLFQRR